MSKAKAAELRAALGSSGVRGPGRRYPPELRGRVARWADAERRRGRDWKSLAQELGLPRVTLERWCGDSTDFVPVLLTAEHDSPAEDTARFTLVAPSGWRIEGLTLDQALQALRMWAC